MPPQSAAAPVPIRPGVASRPMRAPITLDLHITNFTYPGVSDDRLFDHVAEMAKTAEDNGFSSISVMDHLHQIPPIGPQELNMLEGNMALGRDRGRRPSKASLGLLVGGVTYRNPALLAKMSTTLDVISGGRAVFGIGAAWFEAEHDAYGVRFPPLKERFERLEDALRIARAMFTEERATVEGTHHSVHGALNNPRRCAATSRSSSAAAASARRCGSSRSTATAATCSATSSACSTCSACSTATARTSGATRRRSRARGWRA